MNSVGRLEEPAPTARKVATGAGTNKRPGVPRTSSWLPAWVVEVMSMWKSRPTDQLGSRSKCGSRKTLCFHSWRGQLPCVCRARLCKRGANSSGMTRLSTDLHLQRRKSRGNRRTSATRKEDSGALKTVRQDELCELLSRRLQEQTRKAHLTSGCNLNGWTPRVTRHLR